MKISIVIPIYDEEESISTLLSEIKEAIDPHFDDYEIIAVNDGSKDGSMEVLRVEALKNSKIKVVNFRRNFGQTAAMAAGFDLATGEVIIPLDADLQNDPKDIILLVEKLNEGFDIVSGWRKDRQDKLVSRKIPSWIANYIISRVTGVNLHDYGCTMKAYRRDILQDIRLYGEMHRFIPALAAWNGANITEIVTHHRERKFGKTKYGISRIFRVILDLFTVKFLLKYSAKPMHFFGKAGIYLLIGGFISGLIAVFLRIFLGMSFIITPLPLLTVFLMLMGVQFILMGLIFEILIRTYYESQDKRPYAIKEKINLS